MPIKLLGIIALVVLVAVLTGNNLRNVCNIWFFHTFENVPVFAALLASFVLGVLVTLPFTFRKNKSEEKKEDKAEKKSVHKNKSSFFKFNKKAKNEPSSKDASSVKGEPSVTDEDYVPPAGNVDEK